MEWIKMHFVHVQDALVIKVNQKIEHVAERKHFAPITTGRGVLYRSILTSTNAVVR